MCDNSLENYLIECSLQAIYLLGVFFSFYVNGTVMMLLMSMFSL